MKRYLVLLAVLLVQTGAITAPVIVQDGEPRAVIVTADAPSESAMRAARELQHFLELMSGAKLPILTESAERPEGHVKLFVGRSREVKGVDIPSGHDRDATREGFVLKTQGQTVILAGNEEAMYRGTEYAVYELLERLGCRWYFPGEFGQVVPRLETIRVPDLDVAEQPSFVVRNVWMSGWAASTPDYDTWLVRNKGTLRGAFAFPGDGSIHRLVPAEKYADTHPDVYAMNRDGTRQGKETPSHLLMLNTENPKAVELAALSICEHFRENPAANSFGFSAPDGSPQCYSPEAVAANHGFELDSGIGDSISDGYFNFVNNLAHEVTEEFPDRYIVVLAYANRVRPPEGLDRPWNENIIVQLARLRLSAVRPIGDERDFFARRHERTLKAWSRIAPKMLIYDYDPHADLSRMPFWRSRAIAEDMRTYKKYGVIGFTTEGQPTYLRTGLNYYVRTRFMWDLESDVDALLEDFYARFFGPAAAPMKQFIEGIEGMLATTASHMTWTPMSVDWSAIYPPDKVAALGKHLDDAEQLADAAELSRRLSAYRILHDYMTSYLKVYSLHQAGRFEEACEEIEKLPKCIDAAQQIQPGLLPPFPGWVLERGSAISHLRWLMGGVAARAGGKLGDLLGLAPETAQFRTDPHNEGLFEQWQRDEVADQLEWDRIPLTQEWGLSGYRDEKGYGYDGFAWYRFRMPVAAPKGGNAQLLMPRVYAEKAWIWVNGHLVYSPADLPVSVRAALAEGGQDGPRPAPERPIVYVNRGCKAIAVDIQKPLRPGEENTFTVRMIGTTGREQHRGIVDRPLVWSPRE